MPRGMAVGIGVGLAGAFLGLVIGRGSRLAEAPAGPEALPATVPGRSILPEKGPEVALTLEAARKRITELESSVAAQSREIAALRASGSPEAPAPSAPSATPERAPAAAGAASPASPGSPEEVAARIEQIKAEVESAFEAGDGRRALTLLGELARLGPAAYPQAIELYKRIENDVENEHMLNLSRFALYKMLGSEAFVPVLQYAVASPDVDRGFRHRAAGSLVWTDAPDTAAFFLRQLETEKDPGLLSQMAESLAELRDPASLPGLLDLFARRPDQPELRLSLVEAIQDFPEAGVEQKLQSLSAVDPDPRVRSAAEVALAGRNPPVPGYLVSQVFDGTQATKIGLQPGDLIVRYNDVPLNSREDLGRIARSIAPDATASMLVLRKGQYLTIGLKGGRIGIDGRAVQPRAPR